MRYFKEYDASNNLIAIGEGYNGIEITKTEYDALMAQIMANVPEPPADSEPQMTYEEALQTIAELEAENAALLFKNLTGGEFVE